MKRAKRDRWIMASAARWPPLRLELDGGKAGNYSRGDRHPGDSVIPTLMVYFLLGYLLPETEEF